MLLQMLSSLLKTELFRCEQAWSWGGWTEWADTEWADTFQVAGPSLQLRPYFQGEHYKLCDLKQTHWTKHIKLENCVDEVDEGRSHRHPWIMYSRKKNAHSQFVQRISWHAIKELCLRPGFAGKYQWYISRSMYHDYIMIFSNEKSHDKLHIK